MYLFQYDMMISGTNGQRVVKEKAKEEDFTMFLKKTPKAKGTYLAITESYYDKEKKTTGRKP